MKLALSMFLLLTAQGCSSIGVVFNQTSNSADYNPLTLPSVDPDKYSRDKEACLKQVQKQIDSNMTVNYNIMRFRECLIQKGYVLLS